MIDPRTVYVCIPCYKQPEPEVMGSIVSCSGLYAALATPAECSHVGLARNLSVHEFLGTPYEWFVGIDSDTGFTRADFELLMQPCDTDTQYAEDHPEVSGAIILPPRPTRTIVSQCAGPRELDSKTAGAADLLVYSEYSYKDDSLRPVKMGMGFVRIHRSVFEALANLKHDGGSTVEVQRHTLSALEECAKRIASLPDDEIDSGSAIVRSHFKLFGHLVAQLIETKEDKAGQPRLWQAAWGGRHFYDFFPSGPILSQFIPTAEWKGEDQGFFTLCMLAGIIPRCETRTRLVHIGRKGYPYLGPDQGEGQ